LSYDLLLNGTGTHAGAAYSYLYYTLGGTLKALDVHGSSEMSEAYLRQPLIRSRVKNLYAVLRYQHNNLSDHTDSAGVKKDRHLNSWVLSVNGDWRDAVLGGGVNSYVLSYTDGSVNFDNGDAKEADAVAADTQGNYAKWNYNINRLQQVNDKTQVWVSVSGQVAEGNLDSSQKMIVGGPYSVRAYDNGATSGDNGTLVTLELRRFLGNWYGNWQGLIFFDAAQVEVNDHRWAGSTGRNKAHLSGVGAGVTWQAPKQIQARIFAASSTGGNNSLTESSDNTVTWVELAKSF
jgi:hemolysin activation/secretion protein